jgi:hypothetical protein
LIFTRSNFSEAVRIEPKVLKLPPPCPECSGGVWSRNSKGELQMTPHDLNAHNLERIKRITCPTCEATIGQTSAALMHTGTVDFPPQTNDALIYRHCPVCDCYQRYEIIPRGD